jgi:hypothetical protein
MYPGQWAFWRKFYAFLSLSMMVPALFAAAPGNDNYSNRFAIVSSPMVVTASLAGATSENYGQEWTETAPNSFWNSSPPSTLWWGTITLTNPSSLTVEMLEGSGWHQVILWHHSMIPWMGGFRRVGEVFGSSSVSGIQFAHKFATAHLNNGHPPLDLDVQLSDIFGGSWGGFTERAVLRFTVHTNPLILVSPQSRTVSAGESVFFGVHATGHSDLQYQWLHNGVPLAGGNFPLLSLDHVTSSNAGSYRVILTDDLGTNSAEVTLTVSESSVPPVWRSLKRESTNEWSGSLDAETGRSYRIETSMTLTNWSPLTNLTQESVMAFGTAGAVSTGGVVFLARSNSQVRFKTAATQQYFRATRYDSASSECYNNLKRIRFAKELWMKDKKKISSETPDASDLFGPTSYVLQMPVCPNGGTYTIYPPTMQPQCSIHSPLLEPSW